MLCSAFIAQDMSVNLQVAELEQHTYGIRNDRYYRRGVTKEGPMYHIHILYIYIICHSRSSFPFMWGSLRLAPIKLTFTIATSDSVAIPSLPSP